MTASPLTSRSLTVLLTLAALCGSAAHAQQTSGELYGDFRYFLGYAESGGNDDWSSANNASKIGVRGEVSGRGLSAFVDLQTGVSIDMEQSGAAFTQRFYLAGLRGSFGSLSVGRQSTSYKLAGLRLDPFYDSSTINTLGGAPSRGLFAGGSFGMSNLVNGWADRSIVYVSPRAAGVAVNGELFLGTDSYHDFGLGISYLDHGLDAGVQYYDANRALTLVQAVDFDYGLRAHATYRRPGSWSAGVSFEHVRMRNDADQNFLYLVGTANPTTNVQVIASFGFVEDAVGAQPTSGRAYHAGIYYTILPPVRVHGLFSYLDRDRGDGVLSTGVGLTYQFSIRP